MLPTFPNAKKAMHDVFAKEIFRAMWNVCPVLKQIRVRPQTEGKAASYEREDGKVIDMEYQLHRVERSWKYEDARGLSPEEFLQSAADLGEEMGKQMFSHLIGTINQATEEVGNVVNFQGKGFTFDKFLEIVAKMYFSFDDDGQPKSKTFLASPELCQKFSESLKQWLSDPAKRAAYEQVMDRHRKAFYEREARRRMVD